MDAIKTSVNSQDTNSAKRVCHVFSSFPEAPELYCSDINVTEIIERHGHAEFRAGVLTNGLHGHLGVYAIVGVKMGVLACEYFGTGPDNIQITSFAGSKPPVSCMNDGLQVSTGATVGHGLFSLAEAAGVSPAAVFTYKKRSLTLSLKSEYALLIQSEVSEGVQRYGIHTEAYWEYIRRLAIRYWFIFDRHVLFNDKG